MADPVSASPPPGGADNLVAQLQAQAGAQDADHAAKAMRQASQTASEIAAEIHNADAPAPAGSPAPPGLQPPASLAPPPSSPPEPLAPELGRLLAIEVPIIVQLGVRKLSVGEVMRFAVGAIIEFQKSAEEELELLANNRPIGKGHAVKVGENFGLRITNIGSVRETIRALGVA